MIKLVLISVVCGAAVLTVGILIGHYGITKSYDSVPSWVRDVKKDVDESFIEKFLSEVDNLQIQENLRWVKRWLNFDFVVGSFRIFFFVICSALCHAAFVFGFPFDVDEPSVYLDWRLISILRSFSANRPLDSIQHVTESNFILIFLQRELTKVPHMATTPGDEQTVQFMLKRWQDPESGLDQAWREEYMVYLSFPDPKNPNKVTVGESQQGGVGMKVGAVTQSLSHFAHL